MAMTHMKTHSSHRPGVKSVVAFRPRTVAVRNEVQTAVQAPITVIEHGTYSVRGSVRKVNEDRADVKIAPIAGTGTPYVFAGVYDGHGGAAAAEWLKSRLFGVVESQWDISRKPENVMTDAFLEADKQILSAKAGFMGMGERGVGGSKCGATAANVILYKGKDGSSQLLTANVGDARILLIRGEKAIQLSEDHVPDNDDERARIERQNPNPKMPLVRFVGGTWRVGGLLALSRAFGDAYLKGSLNFEGLPSGSDGYSAGFGLSAEPFTTLNTLTSADQWLVVSSDGLYNEETRGGGGGLDNELVASTLSAAAPGTPATKLAQQLAEEAVKVGSTDDVTVVVMRLGSA